MNDTVIVPLDYPNLDQAFELVDRLGASCTFYKVGLELYTAAGPQAVRELHERGKDVFLDLKLHDIPNTVGKAVARASAMGVRFLTVHATGGAAMLERAVEAAGETRLLGVTVLTSMSGADIGQVWGRSIDDVADEVGRLARLANDSGLSGIVCSAAEAALVAGQLDEVAEIVTPGIRLAGDPLHDQSRVTTPADAIRHGATRLVVGRSITQAADPVAAFDRVMDDVRQARVGAS